MEEADRLNAVLEREHPAARRLLSPLGLRLAFPKGILYQADQARHTRVNATIGQVTDGSGQPMPLPSLERAVSGLDPVDTFLYAPVDGPRPLREAWRARERRLAGDSQVPLSLPFATHGLTHNLTLVSSLFADPDTDVIVPQPAWENYDLIFQLHAGARMVRYRPFDAQGRFQTSSLEAALASVRKKAILVLNFPSNPTGWMPTPAQVAEMVRVVRAHPGPLAVVTDDAYQGWVYEPEPQTRSPFWDFAEGADPERQLVMKCDGATKELVFFSSRVGFVTHTAASPEADDAMTSKLKNLVRATVGCASGPALSMVHHTLQDPQLEQDVAARRDLIGGRYRALKEGLMQLNGPRAHVLPFNSAFFAFVELKGGLDAERVRLQLLREHSVGAIAFPDENALRLAYCSIHSSKLGELVSALAASIA